MRVEVAVEASLCSQDEVSEVVGAKNRTAQFKVGSQWFGIFGIVLTHDIFPSLLVQQSMFIGGIVVLPCSDKTFQCGILGMIEVDLPYFLRYWLQTTMSGNFQTRDVIAKPCVYNDTCNRKSCDERAPCNDREHVAEVRYFSTDLDRKEMRLGMIQGGYSRVDGCLRIRSPISEAAWHVL